MISNHLGGKALVNDKKNYAKIINKNLNNPNL